MQYCWYYPSHCWLVVWNMNFMFPYIGNLVIPTDFHIFQRGRYTTNQVSIVHLIVLHLMFIIVGRLWSMIFLVMRVRRLCSAQSIPIGRLYHTGSTAQSYWNSELPKTPSGNPYQMGILLYFIIIYPDICIDIKKYIIIYISSYHTYIIWLYSYYGKYMYRSYTIISYIPYYYIPYQCNHYIIHTSISYIYYMVIYPLVN